MSYMRIIRKKEVIKGRNQSEKNQKPIHRWRRVLNFCLVPRFLDPIWKQFGSAGTEAALFLDEGTDPILSSSQDTVLFDFGVGPEGR